MKILLKVAVVALGAAAGGAQAVVVVDRSPDAVGFSTDFNAVNQIGTQNIFTQFTLAAAVTLTGMDIYSTYPSISPVLVGDAVVVRFRADVGGNPGAVNLFSIATTLSAIDSIGSTSFAGLDRLHAGFAGVTLAAGTYWASLAGVAEIGQSLEYGIPAATHLFTGETDGGNLGVFAPFRLSGDAPAPGVPEPATWLLMIGGFGLTGVVLRRRRLAPA